MAERPLPPPPGVLPPSQRTDLRARLETQLRFDEGIAIRDRTMYTHAHT